MQSLSGDSKILYDPEKQAEWNKGEKRKKEKKTRGKKINDPSLLNHIFLLLLQKYKTVLEDVIMPKIWGGGEVKNYLFLITCIVLKC